VRSRARRAAQAGLFFARATRSPDDFGFGQLAGLSGNCVPDLLDFISVRTSTDLENRFGGLRSHYCFGFDFPVIAFG
jgi:hypothetical protein